jgi:N-acetylglucosamine malate deacetylase 1
LTLVKNLKNQLLKFFARKARPYLKTYGLLQTSKVFNTSALVWNPGNERIVVLAPHMDDEVIGCGGTIARHIAAGSEVSVIFLTDGRRAGDAVGATRKGEARRALQELGVQQIEFLDAADGGLMEAAAALAGSLRAHLQRIQPALVYLPFFLEEHPDHRAASLLLLEAMRGVQLTFRCHGYEVWTPLFPNCLVRIDEALETKKRSLTHYQSQLAKSDYLHTALGLNAYRSNAFLGETCRFAEAFCVLPVSDYLALYQAYRAAR